MLERGFDQAAGLSALKLLPPTRVLPVVQAAGDSSSLELIWRLELALQHMKLPVVVIEGSRGFQVRDARHGSHQVLRRWLEGVPQGSVVMLSAALEALAVLLEHSAARPLVALNEQARTLLAAYNAVKVLRQAARLSPVVLDCGPGATACGAHSQARADVLRANCEQHLGWVPAIWALGYDPSPGGGLGQSEESCVLKVLDTALVLEEPKSRYHANIPRAPRPNPAADQTVGVSDVHRQRHARPGCSVAPIRPSGVQAGAFADRQAAGQRGN